MIVFLLVVCLVLSTSVAHAESLPTASYRGNVDSFQFEAPRTTVMSLYRTDRARRPGKFLYLKPGQEVSHFYTVLQPDGTTITREAKTKLAGVRDDRPLSEKHPNIYVIVIGAQWSISPLIGVATGGIFSRRNNCNGSN